MNLDLTSPKLAGETCIFKNCHWLAVSSSAVLENTEQRTLERSFPWDRVRLLVLSFQPSVRDIDLKGLQTPEKRVSSSGAPAEMNNASLGERYSFGRPALFHAWSFLFFSGKGKGFFFFVALLILPSSLCPPLGPRSRCADAAPHHPRRVAVGAAGHAEDRLVHQQQRRGEVPSAGAREQGAAEDHPGGDESFTRTRPPCRAAPSRSQTPCTVVLNVKGSVLLARLFS